MHRTVPCDTEQNKSALLTQDKTTIQQAAEARLAELGEYKNVSEVAAVLAKQAAGETLSHAEKRLIAKSQYGQQVAGELNTENSRAYNNTLVDIAAKQRAYQQQQDSLRRQELSQNLQALESKLQETNSKLTKKKERGVSAGWLIKDKTRATILEKLISHTEAELKKYGDVNATTASQEAQQAEDNKAVEKSRGKVLDISRTFDRIKAEGQIITDGSHLQNGKLQPNVTYQTGEHEYLYQTNDDGLIHKVYVRELKEKLHDDRLTHDRNTEGKLPGDHAGHLIGDQFGGSPHKDNLVSQAALVNLSDYRKIENQWKKARAEGKKVSIEITVDYESGGTRPVSFLVEFDIDGIHHKKTIKN